MTGELGQGGGEQELAPSSLRDWFQEMYNQLQRMSSELGLDDLREAARYVDLAYGEAFPPQVVRFSVPRGPDERARMGALIDSITMSKHPDGAPLIIEGETETDPQQPSAEPK